MKHFYLFTFILICCSPKSNSEEKEKLASRLTFIAEDIDVVLYQNDTIEIDDFTFAPFGSALIWTFSTNSDSYELNLKDSTWSNLNRRFGKYSYGLKRNSIFVDPFTQFIWICNFRKGIYVYDPQSDLNYEYSSIRPVSTVKFSKTHIFIGTWDGLFTINRKTMNTARGLSEVHIRNIQILSKNILSINEKYEYNFEDDKILSTNFEKEILQSRSINGIEITQYKTTDYQSPNIYIQKDDKVKPIFIYPFDINNVIAENDMIWILNGSLSKGLIQYDIKNDSLNTIKKKGQRQRFQMENGNEHIWFWRGLNIFILNKKTFELKILSPPVVDNIRQICILDDKVFLNTRHIIQVFRKDYLIQLSEDTKDRINSENAFIAYADSLGFYRKNNSFKKAYEIYELAKNEFETSANNDIIDRIKGMKSQLTTTRYNMQEILNLMDYMRDSVDDDEILSSFYLNSITQLNYQGNVEVALRLDTILQSKFPETRIIYHETKMKKTKEAYDRLQNIKTEEVSEDERLWKVGNIYFQLFRFVGRDTEASSTDMTYPFSYYDSLLNIYPNSLFADDAEFTMLQYTENGSHEGGDNSYNPIAIKLYEDFLIKYPSTNLYPNILFEQVKLRRDNYSDNFIVQIQEALNYLDTLQQKYPEFYSEKNAENERKDFSDLLRKNLWDISITSNKKRYQLGEDIKIFFNLINTGTSDKTFSISKNANIPSFGLRVEWYPLNPYDPSHKYIETEKHPNGVRIQYQDTVINQNSSYTEEWVITKSAREAFRGSPGYFRFTEEGKYKLRAYPNNGKDIAYISSPEIWIEIKN
ncbi:MAG: hypothetical protein ABJH98_14450 [Reichenbachiella sp.]|uniref:hypothetical protein n=1 Tax=Reichenbachiella sp. TaxID=2184521 RepID=UPI00329778E2